MSIYLESIGRKPILLNNSFDAPDLWGIIGKSGSGFKKCSDKVTSSLTYKCDQIGQKYQRLINVASTEASVPNKKEVKPLKVAHDPT